MQLLVQDLMIIQCGNEEAHRATFAYLFDDKSTKIKSSYGTGFRFPSLYEMYYVYAANLSLCHL